MLRVTDDLEALLEVIPPHIAEALNGRPDSYELLEVVMDLGRPPQARYPGREVTLSDKEVTHEDIDYVVSRVGEFTSDNRAGIERTLHRISAIRNRKGRIVGLTLRVGRAVFGTVRIIQDLLATGKSILLLGRPGVGKTTLLREAARYLADELHKRVIVVDTSNEIAGDGDIPHPGIGSARRMQVPSPHLQHKVMIEAVENHMPEVIIIDEIGTEQEAAAARTIAERGVQLVATAHGNTLDNLILNPTLSDLVGGVQSVTLSDEEARRRGTQKAILERRAPPTFDMVVEIKGFNQVAIHRDVAATVDAILRGYPVQPELRALTPEGEVQILQEARVETPVRRGVTLPFAEAAASAEPPPTRRRHIYLYGVSRERAQQALQETHFPGTIVHSLDEADALIVLRSHYRRRPQVVREAEERGIPIYVVKSNNVYQLEQVFMAMQRERAGDPVAAALREAEEAIGQVLQQEEPVELSPQNAYIRRLQHLLAQRYNLASESVGRDPYRRVRILPRPPE
jgi:stage III sporulation protein SpoIIIAA